MLNSCDTGYYLDSASNVCLICTAGYYCTGGADDRALCSPGLTTGTTTGKKSIADCTVACANGATCISCPTATPKWDTATNSCKA